ncbi:hypothetical protein T484DRAFT_1894136 [Baffinella frigidus]|nr:hypothetical protein T484DRAFT_1894136 [Cryptophyta sp. CCMP2293]
MDRVRSGRTGSAVTGESPVAAPPAAAAKAPSIDFSAGNRCQAKVVSIAHEFKSKLKEVVNDVMDRQYKLNQQELSEAQRKVDSSRLEELQRVAEAQSRPMTALEKIRMQTLQSMMVMEKHHEASKPKTNLLNTPFTTLLGVELELNKAAYPFLDIDLAMDLLVQPLCDAINTEVDGLYTINQQLIGLASACRKEALKYQAETTDLKTQITALQHQAAADEADLVRFKNGTKGTVEQLNTIRSAYLKEVISVKNNQVDHLKDHGGSREQVESKASHGFDQNLLLQPLGKDASGKELDALVKEAVKFANLAYTQGDAQASRIKMGSDTGDPKDPAAPRNTRAGAGAALEEQSATEVVLRCMRLENEVVQMRIKEMVTRTALKEWRDKAMDLDKARRETRPLY